VSQVIRLLFCALLVLPFGTAAQVNPSEHDPIPADTVITLQRGACEKRCAVYKVGIFADGTLVYIGQYFVRRSGVVIEKVDAAAIRKLLSDFRAADYFKLKDQYGYDGVEGCTSLESDAPIAITSVSAGGLSKVIIHHHRCKGEIPEALTRLEDEIDRVAKSVRWIK